MKRNLYLVLVVTLFSLRCFAQDKIYKKNGDVVEAKVIEIGESEIKYKIFTDQEGPTYSVDKDRLTKIIYQSGREETFKSSLKDETLYEDQSKNAIKINFLSPLLGFTQLNYEHNIKPGRSYEVSLGIIGLGKQQKSEEYTYNGSTGVGVTEVHKRAAGGAFLGAGYKFVKLPNFIRSGDKYSHVMQGIYAKPEVIIGAYSQNKYFYSSSSNSSADKETVVVGAFIINLGKQWVLGDSFLIDLYGGLGYAIDNQDNSNIFNGYGGNHFALNVIGESGVGLTAGFKIGLLINKKKITK
ncbi:MAG: hypothetical protein JWN56_2417 [Sphingobacteriales bacterium]|nr:hypothetical protein [Sphingobacteriales bacterium]